MPYLNIRNYRGTFGAVRTSLARSNDYLGARGPIQLEDGYALPQLDLDLIALDENLTNRVALTNEFNQAVALRDIKGEAVKGRIMEFNRFIRSIAYPGRTETSGMLESLPEVPQNGWSKDRYQTAMDSMIDIWEALGLIELPELLTPLILEGGHTLVNFKSLRTAILSAFDQVINARDAMRANTHARKSLVRVLKVRTVQYCARARALIPLDNDIIQDLPRLYPRYTGAAPGAVSLSGSWDGNEEKAILTWTASEHPNLDHYEIRCCLDTRYRTDEDAVVASVSKDTLSYATTYGLAAVGSMALFKVYAVTKGNREKGSGTVKVIRTESPVPIA